LWSGPQGLLSRENDVPGNLGYAFCYLLCFYSNLEARLAVGGNKYLRLAVCGSIGPRTVTIDSTGSFLSDCSGALCERMVHDSRFCYKLPDHISYDEGALLEPMSVGLYAVRRGQIGIGSRVLVCGAGPVGLMAAVCAKAAGAAHVS
jgi:NADPH:quinone reductase-like Zn-dependent oxidoreductase